MDGIITRSRALPFSSKDIETLCSNKVKIVTYDYLSKVSSLDDVLGPHNACILLYITKNDNNEKYGHWCSLIKHDNGLLEFFDPYGKYIDTQLKYVPNKIKNETGQDYPYLSALIRREMDKGKITEFICNNIHLQKQTKDMSTCGRWTGLRVALRDFSLKDFQHLFLNQNFTPDWYAVAMTLFVQGGANSE